MTKDKKKIEVVKWIVSILAALAFGAYLGSPVPKVWAQPISEAVAVVSEQFTKLELLQNATPTCETGSEIENAGEDSGTAEEATEQNTVQTTESMGNNAVQPTDAGIRIIVSEPLKQPEYIISNANRGTAADRKAKDILIHLINAEAYGLSYKAKVAVGQVVMNRLTGPYYGDDLIAIMTAPHQFTPIYNGSAFQKEIESDSIEAANAVLSGSGVQELTDDTYYFVNPDFTKDKTIETEMEFVCEIEGIHFFKPPAK